MWLLVYGMSVNVNGICYVHVCEQARWAHSAGNSAIEKLCIITILILYYKYAIISLRHTKREGGREREKERERELMFTPINNKGKFLYAQW